MANLNVKSVSQLIFVATMAALVSACGNNPFQRKSNPVEAKEYPNLTKAAQEKRLKPYDGKPVIDPEDPDNTQLVCFEPFEVRVNPDNGYKLLSFVEGTQSTYTIEVRSRNDNDYNIEVQRPKNSSWTVVQRSANLGTYEFKWTPKKNNYNGETIEKLTLKFSSETVSRKCGGEITETINLLVTKSAPTQAPRNIDHGKSGQDACYEPYKISIDKDLGNRMMAFTEEVQNGYNLTIRGLLDDNFEVTPVLPQNATWRVVSRKGNVGKYRFNYQPSKNQSDDQVRFLILNFTSDLVVNRCGPEASQALVNLFVKKSSVAPTVTFQGLAAAPVQYPTVSAFRVEIIDPASTDQQGPVIQAITFPASASNGERKLLDASAAVTCGRPSQVEGNRWQADCQFNPSLVKGIGGLEKSGKVVDVAFAVTAFSKRSQIVSAASSPTRSLRVEFLKPPEPIVTEAPSAAVEQAKPKKEAAPKKATPAKVKSPSKSNKTASKGAKK